MSELPRGWVEARLGDVLKPRSEKADPSTVPDLPFLGLEDVEAYSGRVIGYGSTADMKSSVALFSKGDLLFGRLRPYLQKILIADCDGAASAEFIVMKSNRHSHLGFFSALLRSDQFLEYTALVSSGDRPRVSYESIADFNLPLPPLAEQKRIVAKLDSLNAKSTRARSELVRIETLVSRYKQAVLDLLCDVSHSTASLRELVDQKRGIPYGIVQTGKPVVDGVPTVRCGDIKNYSIRKNELKLVDRQIARQYGRTELVGGEVLIAIRGSIGETCVADNDLVGCNISREVAMIPLLPGTSPQFVMYFLKSNKAKEFIGANTKGSAQQGINLGDLRNLPIPALRLEEQHEIVCRIESAFAKIDRLAKEAKRALELVGRLDEAILAKAFRGELVPQDENDEPAEKLLERIRAERQAAPKVKKRIAKRTSAMLTARDFLNAKLPNWPHDGISFQELRSEFSGSYDNLKDAVFAMLSDENAPLRQVFDEQRSTMTLRKREQ
ncbi:hypothetical protein GOB46_16010 [Sinorhizobium meliloti]|uniref:restriction endonuclease subunit S n=1 Tax=Rhizobium meliloti TaxID=382 RepID=UPI00299E915B|nr:hypothetical protein [Sinorhizobium meliloti]MDW9872273.1 hypothetical protein [Sinorhizobium meliloti]MDW9885419.1 hypothetical protein [Sinorhizobium meliloti]MDX0207298.1 hypothetical protein [Sinorhizobium meliloti]